MVRTLSYVVFEVSGIDIHSPGLGRAGDPHEMNGKGVADFFKADGIGIFLPVREMGVQMECQQMEDHRGEHHGLDGMEPAFVPESAAQLAGLLVSAELDLTRRRRPPAARPAGSAPVAHFVQGASRPSELFNTPSQCDKVVHAPSVEPSGVDMGDEAAPANSVQALFMRSDATALGLPLEKASAGGGLYRGQTKVPRGMTRWLGEVSPLGTAWRRARRKPAAGNLREWRCIRPESRAMRSRESAGGRRWLLELPSVLGGCKSQAFSVDLFHSKETENESTTTLP